MIPLSGKAERDLDKLTAYYESIDRPEATRNVLGAVRRAAERIARSPDAGLPAPRPYPELASLGRLWIKEGAYWISFTRGGVSPVISGVFHEAADIPRRI